MQLFKKKEYFIQFENGERRYFPNEYEKKKFESLNNYMLGMDNNRIINNTSPFHKEQENEKR